MIHKGRPFNQQKTWHDQALLDAWNRWSAGTRLNRDLPSEKTWMELREAVESRLIWGGVGSHVWTALRGDPNDD